MQTHFHIADADALIATLSKEDANHRKATAIIRQVTARREQILFPATAITEAITTMQVRLANPALAKVAVAQVAASALSIVLVDADILTIATALYHPEGSKKGSRGSFCRIVR